MLHSKQLLWAGRAIAKGKGPAVERRQAAVRVQAAAVFTHLKKQLTSYR